MTPIWQHKSVDIVEATARDASFVTYNMRADDWAEVSCQLMEGVGKADVGLAVLDAEFAFVARLAGTPAFLFGFSPYMPVGLSVFGFGTKLAQRTIPAVTRFMREVQGPALAALGYRHIEARSLASHHDAHRWMEGGGAVKVAELPNYGKDGEDFFLFRWTEEVYKHPITSQQETS